MSGMGMTEALYVVAGRTPESANLRLKESCSCELTNKQSTLKRYLSNKGRWKTTGSSQHHLSQMSSMN
ncbi:hypothetical protein ACLB2K_057512 [Fragaria x ananassa]